jgi:hypothetical protein
MGKCEPIITGTKCQVYQLIKFHMNVQANIIGTIWSEVHPSIFRSFGILCKYLFSSVWKQIFYFCPSCYFPSRSDTLYCTSRICPKDKVCTACRKSVQQFSGYSWLSKSSGNLRNGWLSILESCDCESRKLLDWSKFEKSEHLASATE